MPIYEYRCSSCGFQNEYLQRVSDPQLTVCPECGQPSFKKLVSAAGFQLKGSGWYVTDFKNPRPAANNGAKPAEAQAKSGVKSEEAKSEGKPSTAAACGSGACPECS